MKHCGTQRIETERLVLRRFSVDDAQAMYQNWASDDEVTRYLTWPAHASIKVSKAVLEVWVKSYSEPTYYQWAIVLKDHGSDPIGSISAVSMNDDIDMVHIGYCIGKDWWHQGVMSEALKAVMDFFFDQVGANRVESRHDPRNPYSGMVMKKWGNIKYDYYTPTDDNDDLLLVEKWRDADALAAHGKQQHFARLGELKTEFVTETIIEKFEI